MEKMMILDTVLKELEETRTDVTGPETMSPETIALYGIRNEESSVITSRHMKKGLKKIGVFAQGVLNLIPPLSVKEPTLFMEPSGELKYLYNEGDDSATTFPVEVINYATDFGKRLKGIVDETVLRERSVTIIGAGSGGSATACVLARSGVEKLTIIDHDKVSVSNICRSTYDLTDVGRIKVEALYDQLIKINPNADIQIYAEDILEMDTEKLMGIIEGSDLIIEATDNVKTKRVINGLAHKSVPVIYPSVYAGGKGGDIFMSIPGFPCFECVFSSTFASSGSEEKREWDYSTGEPKPMPGLLADIQVIVARSVKLALAILTGDSDEAFIEKVTEPGCFLLLIGNESGFSIFDRPFQEIWAETEIDPECFCQTLC